MGSAWRDGRRKQDLFYALSNISTARPAIVLPMGGHLLPLMYSRGALSIRRGNLRL